MKRFRIFLLISFGVLVNTLLSATVMAQVIIPQSGTKGAGAINSGVTQFNQGQLNTALIHFKKAIEAAPRSAVAHYNMALTLNRMGNTEKAKKHFQNAKKFGKVNPFIQNSDILKQHTQGHQKKR